MTFVSIKYCTLLLYVKTTSEATDISYFNHILRPKHTLLQTYTTNIAKNEETEMERLLAKIIDPFSVSLKGTVSRDFSCPVFFIKHLLLVPIGTPRTDFEFFRIFVELFVFVIDSPAMNTPGSRLESFRFGSFCKHKSHALQTIFRMIDPLKIVVCSLNQ